MKLKGRVITFVALVFLVGIFSYTLYKEGTLPVDKNKTEKILFTVNRGETIPTILNKLKSEELIRNKVVFYILVRIKQIEKNIQAGVFRLSPSMDAYRIAKELTHGSIDVSVTLVEGQRKEEIAQKIGYELGFPEAEFINKADEGYLFPDTYFFPKDAPVDTVITILTKNFNKKFAEAKQKVPKKNNLSDAEIVTLASLIEREAKFDEDRPAVANILLKRLRENIPLQVDATLQYMLGYEAKEKKWWRKSVYNDDKLIDSPYNTYKNAGLPVGPIANPGILAIEAALGADGNTPYIFYINEPNGKMHVARTLEEHQRNIDKYLK